MDDYQSAAHLAEALRPSGPTFCLRPHAARNAARWFRNRFSGTCLYAVKANEAPWLLEIMRDEGMSFDVASIAEARRVRSIAPNALIGFMHPVKSKESIREAYFSLGVRVFALDSLEELNKIVDATEGAGDLTLCVRIAVPGDLAKISLASKFGASADDAPALLRRTRQIAARLGVCFHVGSQAMAPAAFTTAIERVERSIIAAGVIVDVLDVGGGFPAPYPGMLAPPLQSYVDAIEARFERMLVAENCELWCEPGRALSAEAASLIVRVEARRGEALHINDGVYGALFDAGALGWVFPTRLLRPPSGPREVGGFSFFGPTCDDHDAMEGPFYLPTDVQTGDYIEIGMLGAYGAAMATRFNGFGDYEEHLVADAPMMTAYGDGAVVASGSSGAANGPSAKRCERSLSSMRGD